MAYAPPQKSEPKSTQLSEKITSRTVRRRRVVYMDMRAYCVLKNKSAVSLRIIQVHPIYQYLTLGQPVN